MSEIRSTHGSFGCIVRDTAVRHVMVLQNGDGFYPPVRDAGLAGLALWAHACARNAGEVVGLSGKMQLP